ncbi:PREDICTED: peptidyl-prolyl cis-trans isomerase CWC27 homolog, partial [Eufriesea mexicana]|uniref:peptidyl-prolyl cis-trans isomerase CWC27 homolog n=1 Tax=Eufriesea mexicana TaxID=516756 RepID=UPI00083C4F04
MELWHIMDFIKPMLKGGKRILTNMSNIYIQGPPTMAKNEFRTRIRSYGRGLIAVANAGKDDNTSQFLFTLGSTLELQSKHTILGKVILETIYNMLKFEKAPVDE